jgi:hypothetical protein
MSPRVLALLALALSLGTLVAFLVLVNALIPFGPLWYLTGLAVAALAGAAAVWRARRWLTLTALAVAALLLGAGVYFNFVMSRLPAVRPAFVVGQRAPDFTLPDAAGRSVSLADYRGRKPVVLVFYRGYW